MALTTMDAQPALVVIDLQNGITAVPTVHPLDDVIQRSAALAAAFRRHGLPVTKRTWGAFHGTPLDTLLRDRGVTQIVLTGVATSAGVESTARAAHEHGYHVVLAIDAMTDRDADAHDHSVQRIFPRIGETATTGDILAMLDKTR